MKITKQQLNQIIKEEFDTVLAEGEAGLYNHVMHYLKQITDLKMRRIAAFLVIGAVARAGDSDEAQSLALQINKEDPELRVDA